MADERTPPDADSACCPTPSAPQGDGNATDRSSFSSSTALRACAEAPAPPRLKVQRDVVMTAIRIANREKRLNLAEDSINAITQEVVDAYAAPQRAEAPATDTDEETEAEQRVGHAMAQVSGALRAVAQLARLKPGDERIAKECDAAANTLFDTLWNVWKARGYTMEKWPFSKAEALAPSPDPEGERRPPTPTLPWKYQILCFKCDGGRASAGMGGSPDCEFCGGTGAVAVYRDTDIEPLVAALPRSPAPKTELL